MRADRCCAATVGRVSGVAGARRTPTPIASIWCSLPCARAWRLKRAAGSPFFVDKRLRHKWTTPQPRNTVSTRQFGTVTLSEVDFFLISFLSLSLSLSLYLSIYLSFYLPVYLSFSLVVEDDRSSKKWD